MLTLAGLRRLIDKQTARLRASLESMIEWAGVSSVSAPADQPPSASLDDGDDVTVWEPYGFASAPSSGQAITLAPGADSDNLVALVTSVGGRPATDGGDVSVWTAGGHLIALDDDGGLTITGKDGAVIDIADTGKITITAASLADIDIIVDGGQSVNVGDALAVALLKAQAAQTHLVQAAAYATQPGNFAPQDGGVLAFTNFGAFLAGTAIVPPAIPGNDLVNAAATTKAKGT